MLDETPLCNINHSSRLQAVVYARNAGIGLPYSHVQDVLAVDPDRVIAAAKDEMAGVQRG